MKLAFKKILAGILIGTLLMPYSFDPPMVEAATCGFGSEVSAGICRGFITTVGTGSFVVPNDWTSFNKIEVIGGGGAGGGGNGANGPVGGGGGAYAAISNLVLTAGASITVGVGAGGTGNAGAAGNSGDPTWFNAASAGACTGASTCVKGAGGTGSGAGGSVANSIGTTEFAGGSGGAGDAGDGGGGGGAGGPNGAGADGGDGPISGTNVGGAGGGGGGGGSVGGDAANGTTGANGGNNYLGAGAGTGGTSGNTGGSGSAGGGGGGGGSNAAGGIGGNGTDWSASFGSGGGGGGAGGGSVVNGGAAGTYGGGGGGGARASGSTGGSGAQGLIVITYEKVPTRTMRLFSSIKIYSGKVVVYPTLTTPSAPADATLTFVDSAESVAATITIPNTSQAGDVAILFDSAFTSGSTPADVIPTNWTGLTTFAGTQTRVRLSYKIIAGGEPGSSITGLDGANQEDKVMLVFRGDAAITAVSAEDWTSDISVDDPASQTANASGQTAPLIVFGMAWAINSTGAFSTQSPSFDGEVSNSDADMVAGYKIYESSPADHTIDMADLGAGNGLASGFLELTY